MKRAEIKQYQPLFAALPPAARAAIAAADWARSPRWLWALRTHQGYSPLGLALAAGWRCRHLADPSGRLFARVIGRPDLQDVADAFVANWDADQVSQTDLRLLCAIARDRPAA